MYSVTGLYVGAEWCWPCMRQRATIEEESIPVGCVPSARPLSTGAGEGDVVQSEGWHTVTGYGPGRGLGMVGRGVRSWEGVRSHNLPPPVNRHTSLAEVNIKD